MKRMVLVLAAAALVAATLAISASSALADGHGDSDCTDESNTQSGALNNTNVRGSQQNQQGSNNVQEDNDAGGLIGDIPDDTQQHQQGNCNVQLDNDIDGHTSSGDYSFLDSFFNQLASFLGQLVPN